jgi:hypothetical protein
LEFGLNLLWFAIAVLLLRQGFSLRVDRRGWIALILACLLLLPCISATDDLNQAASSVASFSLEKWKVHDAILPARYLSPEITSDLPHWSSSIQAERAVPLDGFLAAHAQRPPPIYL